MTDRDTGSKPGLLGVPANVIAGMAISIDKHKLAVAFRLTNSVWS